MTTAPVVVLILLLDGFLGMRAVSAPFAAYVDRQVTLQRLRGGCAVGGASPVRSRAAQCAARSEL